MGATHDASIVNSFMTNFRLHHQRSRLGARAAGKPAPKPGWRSRPRGPLLARGARAAAARPPAGGGAAAVQVVRKRVGAPVRVVRPPADGVARPDRR